MRFGSEKIFTLIFLLCRDAGVIAIGHFVWSILSVLFVFSLLGVAHQKESINMENIKNSEHAVAITGKGFWLVGITLAETAIAGKSL